jgi:hypothetical protein
MELILTFVSAISIITALILFRALHSQTQRADRAEAALARVEAKIRDTEDFFQTVLAIKDSGVL